MSGQEKKNLREKILPMRAGLARPEVEKMSALVTANLVESGLMEGVRTAALYASADGEVMTRPLAELLRERGAEVFLPRVRGKGPIIDFFAAGDWDGLIVSGFGIPEPAAEGEPADPGSFDFVLVPGIAFDRSGGRLGYGMGCYDRFLERTRPGTVMVGVCYDFQLVEKVPMDEHDVFLTAVVTDREIALADQGGRLNIKVKGEKP